MTQSDFLKVKYAISFQESRRVKADKTKSYWQMKDFQHRRPGNFLKIIIGISRWSFQLCLQSAYSSARTNCQHFSLIDVCIFLQLAKNHALPASRFSTTTAHEANLQKVEESSRLFSGSWARLMVIDFDVCQPGLNTWCTVTRTRSNQYLWTHREYNIAGQQRPLFIAYESQ